MENDLCKYCGFSLSFLQSSSVGYISVWCSTLKCTVFPALPGVAGGAFPRTARVRLHLSFAGCFHLISWTSLVSAFELPLWRIGQVSCNNVLPHICSVSSWVAQTVFLISLNSSQSRIVASCRNYKKLFKAFFGRVYYILGTVDEIDLIWFLQCLTWYLFSLFPNHRRENNGTRRLNTTRLSALRGLYMPG